MAAAFPARTGGKGPHAGQPLATAGPSPAHARLALVMLHGRGADPRDMLGLYEHLAVPDVAAFAPAAAGRSWWPDSFLAPLSVNGTGLESGLSMVESLLDELEGVGFGSEQTVLIGFSQGACLALEASARLARPFRAVAALSGGLVGTGETDGPALPELYDRSDKQFSYGGSLAGVPVLIGCHERDPHIPLARVRRSADVLGTMGAEVDTIVIPGAGHGIVAEEAAWLRGALNDG